ncbi:MAG: PAS domain S-box protein [Chloroflexota bacterium]
MVRDKMSADKKRHIQILTLTGLVVGIIFFVDSVVPLGVASGILYAGIVLVTLWLPRRRYTVLFAILSTIATIAGALLSPPGGVFWQVLFNRVLAIFAIWIIAFLVTQRKQTDKILKDNEATYRYLVESIGSIPWTVDLRTNQCTYVGPQAYDILGYPLEDWYTDDFWSRHIHPDDRDFASTYYLKALGQSPTCEFEYRMIAADGREVWLHDIVSVIDGENGPEKLQGFMVDITHRKQADLILQKSEERFRNLIEGSIQGMIVHRGFKPLFVNETYVDLFGYKSIDEFLSLPTIKPLLAPQEYERLQEFNEARIKGNAVPDYYTYDALRKDGSRMTLQNVVRVIEWDNQPAIQSTVINITEQTRAENALREREALLDVFFSQSLDGFFFMMLDEPIAWHDEADKEALVDYAFEHQRITKVNDAMLEQFGGTREDYIGLTPNDLYAHNVVVGKEGWRDFFDIGRQHVERPSKRLDGAPIWLEGDYICIYDEQGRIKGHFGAQRDITARKQYEEEREKLITELAAKNAELEQFTYMVSHDLKSPLITIKGFLGLLEQDIADRATDRIQGDIDYIAKAANKMGDLLEDLLELSRVGRVVNPPQSIVLKDLIDEVLVLVAGQILNTEITVDIPNPSPIIFADRPRLLEVLQNLIANAAKFTKDQPSPYIEIGSKVDETYTTCWVRDNGIGIAPRYHKKIFTLFEKLDPNSEGTGIGLALVKRIIETHNGNIWVDSKGKGQGSTFYFTLPSQNEAVSIEE